jgi:hypothetical protein
MKHFFRTSVAALFIALGLMQNSAAFAANSDPGNIELFYGDSHVCTLPIEVGQVNFFHKQKDCKYAGYSDPYVKLNNVRSGAFITISTFRDGDPQPQDPNYGCHNNGNYAVTFKVIKDKTTTPPIRIYDMQKYDIGKPVMPGLLVVNRAFHHPHYLAGISCLRIEFR